ncbi:MAG: conjugal transfer protein TraM [Tatlockia sp.]|nr:conjugal transfer protein TraM [Tatlockia sp.]
MQNSTEILIQEIALKHGAVMSRNDPLLVMQTINAQLMKDNASAQEALLQRFKEELESIALQWEKDAKDKAERILNASLAASKESMSQCLQNSADMTAIAIKKEVDNSLARASLSLLKSSRRLSIINLAASGLIFFAACFLIFGSYLQ